MDSGGYHMTWCWCIGVFTFTFDDLTAALLYKQKQNDGGGWRPAGGLCGMVQPHAESAQMSLSPRFPQRAFNLHHDWKTNFCAVHAISGYVGKEPKNWAKMHEL